MSAHGPTVTGTPGTGKSSASETFSAWLAVCATAGVRYPKTSGARCRYTATAG